MGYLTKDEVLEAIKQYSKTAAGKEEIKKRTKRKREFVPEWWNKNAAFRKYREIKAAAADMKEILYKHIITDTVTTGVDADGNTYQRVGLSKFEKKDIHVHPPIKTGPGEYQCNISISKSALHRDSLLSNSEGIDDIISLFVHGYSNAKQSVHGEWHGMEIFTPRNREPNQKFLQNAIDEFNNKEKYKKKAVAILYDQYTANNKGGGS